MRVVLVNKLLNHVKTVKYTVFNSLTPFKGLGKNMDNIQVIWTILETKYKLNGGQKSDG